MEQKKQNSAKEKKKKPTKTGHGPKFPESISKRMEVTCLENTSFPHVKMEKGLKMC